MAGHSKWANIKHRKDRADKQKGKIFSRLAKEIITAVKHGGADPKSNSRLKLALQKAKDYNFPNDNIERNIKKASAADQQDFVEMTYELYGFGGVGIIVDIMTDNKNRISSDIRIATNKCGGSIASPGAVSYNFDRKGVLQVLKKGVDEEKLFSLSIDCGAEDFDQADDFFIITTRPDELYKVKECLEVKNIKCLETSLEMIPKSLIECSKENAEKNNKLIEWLENIDDVDAVFHNMDE
jgi:YebC/PmpR family DNA-binding regulatory protein